MACYCRGKQSPRKVSTAVGIRVLFKGVKQQLSFGDYQMLRYRAMERCLCFVLIAYDLLNYLAVEEAGAEAEKGWTVLRLFGIPHLQERLRGRLWDDLSRILASRYKSTNTSSKQLVKL